MGVKIVAQGLDNAIAGTQLLVAGPKSDIDALKDEVMSDLATILARVDKSGNGVYVQASTLGSLEALLSFLNESKIPVFGIAIGPVHKSNVVRASVMIDKRPEYATILAFDVKVTNEAQTRQRLSLVCASLNETLFTISSMIARNISSKSPTRGGLKLQTWPSSLVSSTSYPSTSTDTKIRLSSAFVLVETWFQELRFVCRPNRSSTFPHFVAVVLFESCGLAFRIPQHASLFLFDLHFE